MTLRLPRTTPTRLLLATALTTGTLTAAALAPAQAVTWGLTPTTTLANAASSVTMGSDNSGGAAAAWLAGGQVWVSEKAPNADTWSSAVVVSTGTDGVTNPGYAVREPDLDVSPAGHIAVTWTVTAPGSTNTAVFETQKDPGGAFVAARQISENQAVNDHPQVDIGPAGVATVAWLSTAGTNAAVRAKEVTTAGPPKSPEVFKSPDGTTNGEAGTYADLSLARGGNGDVMAVWRHVDPGATAGKVLVARKSGSAWATTPIATAPAAYVAAPTVVADGLGHASVAWVGGASAGEAVPMIAYWRKGSTLGAGSPLTSIPGSGVRLSVNTSGLLAATWISASGLIYADVRDSGITTVNLTPGVAVTSADVGFSDSGAATVAYNPAGQGQVGVAYRPMGQAFGTTTTASAVGAKPLVATRADSAVIVWSDDAGGPVQSADLATSAPVSVHMTSPLKLFNSGTTIAAGWIGTPGVGPLTYEVTTRSAPYNGSFGPDSLWQSTTATSASYAAKRGMTVCFTVRGVDTVGSASAVSVPRCTTTPLDDRKFKRAKVKKKVWVKKKGSGNFANTYLETKRKGAVLTMKKVRASKVALLVQTKKGFGSVKVKIGKKTIGTASFARTGKGLRKQQIVTVGGGGKQVRSGKLKIITTTKGKPVRIDGVYLAQ